MGGTPTAIVVRAPSGELASYHGHGRGPRWTCGYYAFENESPTSPNLRVDYSSGPVEPEPGQGYVLGCRDDSGVMVYGELVVYDPVDPLGGVLAAQRAAELALAELDLPAPGIALSPPGEQLVGVPTWLWVDVPWEPMQASATIGAVTATVTARPVAVDWDLGDGSRVRCAGPGTPYDTDRPAAEQQTDCAHTYIWPSSRAGGSYRVSATVSFEVDWTATTGEAGPLGVLGEDGAADVVVRELQAVLR